MTDNAAFLDGVDLAKRGDHSGAIACFDRAIAINPVLAEAYYRRGLAYFDLGQFQQASFDYSRAIDLAGEYRPALYARALVRVALDHFGGALEDLARLLQLEPKDPAAHQLQATALRKQGNVTGAIASLKKAAELYLDRRDPTGAKHCLELLKQLQPTPPTAIAPSRASDRPAAPAAIAPIEGSSRPEAFYVQALARAETGDVNGAITELDWALKLDPQDAQALACRAAVRIKQGNWQGAIADCNQAIQGGNAEAITFRHRARAKLELGDQAGAVVDLDRALELDGNDPLLWIARGDAKQATGDYLGAIEDYNRALALGGDRPTILLLRAQSAVRVEDLLQAIEDYQTAASLFCDRNDWERYRATLDQLKMIQQPSPAPIVSAGNNNGNPGKPQNPLWQRLLGRVGGQEAIAQTLLDRARDHYPGMDDDWYLEKVLYDLERDSTDEE